MTPHLLVSHERNGIDAKKKPGKKAIVTVTPQEKKKVGGKGDANSFGSIMQISVLPNDHGEDFRERKKKLGGKKGGVFSSYSEISPENLEQS